MPAGSNDVRLPGRIDPERASAIRVRISNSRPVGGSAGLFGRIDRSKAAPNIVARPGERQGRRLA
jgi:hypothetical protein